MEVENDKGEVIAEVVSPRQALIETKLEESKEALNTLQLNVILTMKVVETLEHLLAEESDKE